ncbi:hypothetical protein BUALT_Bualt14G0021000 [Buddleja alternifolia]|uniref:Gag protein n=1 Tax=Buddleja alternifolia TaxID=168488 RepID=A0AAV6WFJ6_9LAMI|nr:hypothetical protein BUALT_Bualt14G0021000 [Buddleja alternifolia]
MDLITWYGLSPSKSLGAQRKLSHITKAPPAEMEKVYEDWLATNYCVRSWLINSIEERISSVIFLPIAKPIWDMLHELYGHEKNISHIFELYEQLFSLQQGDYSVTELNTTLHGILYEIDIHQPLLLDMIKLREYCEGLAVAKFMSALHPEISNQIGGHQGRALDSGKDKCAHCGRTNHPSDKCWKKFSKPKWA